MAILGKPFEEKKRFFAILLWMTREKTLRVTSKRTPRSFQSRNLTEVPVFSTVLPHFRYSSVETHCKSDRGVTLATESRSSGYKKNETRHSREAPHTNHIINTTKTNNRVQRYGHSVNPQ